MKLKGEILISGGGGFIGANLAHRLCRLGLRPHLLLRKGGSDWRIASIRKNVRLYECDITDETKIHRLVKQIKPKYIFHFATYGGYSFQEDRKKILQVNLWGTFQLLNACLRHGFQLFVNNGSSSEYGFKNFPCDEETLLEPNSYYAVTKASATLYCQYVANAFNQPIITFRLYSVYGPYEEPARFIPTLIRSAFRKRTPPLVSPRIARDFIHVDDVMDLYLQTLKRNSTVGDIFNVGTGKQSSIHDVVSTVSRLTGAKFKLNWGSMKKRIWDTNIWACNNGKVKRFFKWKPQYNLKSGLEKTIEWYRANPHFLDTRLSVQ